MEKILLIVSVVFTLPFSLCAEGVQDKRTPRPRRVVANEEAKHLNENLTIVLEGAFVESAPFSLSSTVSKRFFNAKLLTESNGNVVSVSYKLEERDDKVELTYTIATQVVIQKGKSGTSYRDLLIEGAVLLKPNESKKILTNGKNSISVKVIPENEV